MEEMRFEEAFKRLEDIVKELEKGDIALDDALALYEEGQKYASLCRTKLDTAEQKIEKLVKRDEGFELEEFEESGGSK
jgi:exodeoxyribonuclease VII small subunit